MFSLEDWSSWESQSVYLVETKLVTIAKVPNREGKQLYPRQ